jgi:hypothetical protein
MTIHTIALLLLLPLLATSAEPPPISKERLPIDIRAKQVKDMR